jgi:hypothetical protein
MQKLTPQQLQFIDTYLKNSGVRYDDIRYEMTDHVASAIEEMPGDFRENFCSYMINHKVELKNSNKVFKELAFSKAISVITRNLTNVRLYIITTIIFAAACFAVFISGIEDMASTLHMSLIIVSSVMFIDFWRYKIFSKSSHSVIDKLLTVVYFGAIFIRIDMLIQNAMLLNLYYSFCIAFFVLLTQSLYRLKRQYKLRYGA